MERSSSLRDVFRSTFTQSRNSGSTESARGGSIFRRSSISKDAAEDENKSQERIQQFEEAARLQASKMKEVLAATEALLQQPVRLLNKDRSFLNVSLQMEVSEEHRYLIISKKGQELERLLLEVTSMALETVLGENAFEVITVNKVLHLSPYSEDVTLAWIAHLRAFIAQCEPYPDDGLYKEALIRQPGESYDVKLTKKQPLGVTFERSVEWLHVKIGNSIQLSDFKLKKQGIVTGSVLSKINETTVAQWSYKQVLDMLSEWEPPMKLTFRRAPSKKGFLNRRLNDTKQWKRRYFELEEGLFRYFDNDSPKKRELGKVVTYGMSVRLADPAVVGRENCFVILYGFDELVMQADSREEMFDWACALYYGIAISNGGGYVLALEALCVKENKSKQEVVAEAIARMAKKELSKRASISPEDLNRAEQEVKEGVMDDLARKQVEAQEKVSPSTWVNVDDKEDEPVEAVDSENPLSLRSAESDLPSECLDSIDVSHGFDEREDDDVEALPEVEIEVEPVMVFTPDEEEEEEEVIEALPEVEMEPETTAASVPEPPILGREASDNPLPLRNAKPDQPIEHLDAVHISHGLSEEDNEEMEALPDEVEVEPEMATAAAYTAPVAPSTVHSMDVTDEKAAIAKKLAPEDYLAPGVTTEDVKRVFHIYAKPGDSGDYINVMQFSTIWRLATKTKGNLFEEMKVFNSAFDLEGKGFAVEADFIRGWKTVSKRGFGDEIFFNLAKIEIIAQK